MQRVHQKISEITAKDWDQTFRTNIYAHFFLCQAAVPHMKAGASIINTTSINTKKPSPQLLACATTKGAIANFRAGLAGILAEKGIGLNAVAQGQVWTPPIPSTNAKGKGGGVRPGDAVRSSGTAGGAGLGLCFGSVGSGQLHDRRGQSGDGRAADALGDMTFSNSLIFGPQLNYMRVSDLAEAMHQLASAFI